MATNDTGYYGNREAKRKAAAVKRVKDAYRWAETKRYVDDIGRSLNGPFQPDHAWADRHTDVPEKGARPKTVVRIPYQEDIRRMRPDDYDASKTIDVPNPNQKGGNARKYWRAAKRAGAFAKLFNPYSRYWDAAEYASEYFDEWAGGYYDKPLPSPIPNPANGWYQTTNCAGDINSAGNRSFPASGICLGGQSLSYVPGVFRSITASDNSYSQAWTNYVGATTRSSYRKAWRRSSVAINELPLEITSEKMPLPTENVIKNPNNQRWRPSVPDLSQWYRNQAAKNAAARERADDARKQRYADFAKGALPQFWDRTWPKPGRPKPPVESSREPPENGVHERKIMPRSRKIGVALWRAMDAISEGAEVISAIYDALPADVKGRWKCNKPRPYSQGDAWGQYGIDGADCKARAVYFNWNKVDISDAIENIMKNWLEDKIIGAYQGKAPVNMGAAHQDAEREFAQWLGDNIDEIFDRFKERYL